MAVLTTHQEKQHIKLPEYANFTYQEIIDTRQYLVMGRELLFREASKKRVDNNDYLGIYNHSLSIKFDRLVTKALIEQCDSCVLQSLNHNTHVNININHGSLSDHYLLGNIYRLRDILHRQKISLVVELIEYTKPTYESISLVAELQENGIKIAIDDFGTGYNTPSNLSGIDKPDYVKLIYDASAETLEQGIDSALNSFDITQSDIIVEHIDSPLKSHIAATLGLHYQQGFLFNHR